MMERADYVGMDRFVWWHGVVEDIDDPMKLGRVRVRVLGWHTEDKTDFGIPTKDLPWAQVMQSPTSPSMSGLGRSPTGLLQGSWVIGFFLDGLNAQQPLVMGTYGGIQKPDYQKKHSSDYGDIAALSAAAIAGIVDPLAQAIGNAAQSNLPETPYNDIDLGKTSNRLMNTNIGFRDPDGIYPVEGRMNEPDTNRLARNENIEWTVVQKKKDSRLGCETALYGYWEEPVTPYAAKYPHNHVTETASGHIIEVDDTPGHERLHTYHKSGTFNEIHPNGSEVHKVVGNEWNITLNDRMIYVRGNTTLNSDKLLKIRVGKHLEIETEGEMRVLVKGNTVMETQGNCLHKVKGKYTVASEGNMLFVAPRIDFNPRGSSAVKIKTLLSKLRTTIKKVFRRS
jgi:hypothetical protein